MRSSYLIKHPELLGAPTDFSDPLGMMIRCHDYIAHHCLTLRRLAHDLQAHGTDDRARRNAAEALRYFETEGRRHHEDEEFDLFPRLLSAAAARGEKKAATLIARLRSQHRDLDCSWQVVQEDLQRIVNGEDAVLSVAAVDRFDVVHSEHMRIEEEELMQLARSLLTPAELAALGEAMAARRGVVTGDRPCMLQGN